MSTRKKPRGAEWEAFVEEWYINNHEGKLALAKRYDITYDTAKHFISESGATRKQVREELPTGKVAQEEAIKEVLALTPRAKLYFSAFDIEATGLKADFSVLLSAVIKPYGQEPTVFRADDYPNWAEGKRGDDFSICRAIAQELAQHAVIFTHYGTGYDIKYLRQR